MGLGTCFVKYILFTFNFMFALGGLTILLMGITVYHQTAGNVQNALDINVSFPATVLVIVGTIIFIIAFFGCCGAIRENYCMIITFTVFVMTLLVIQIAVAVYVFSNLSGELLRRRMDEVIKTSVQDYYSSQEAQVGINVLQSLADCCGYESYRDYTTKTINQSVPYSCCGLPAGEVCTDYSVFQRKKGCKYNVPDLVYKFANMMGSSALIVGGIELIGIIFSLCLASSIRNAERRGYKV